MIKLVALDLDGTIVNENLEISPRVLKMLKHLVTQTDTRVVIATGRMFFSALPFAGQIGIKEPLITFQGAMIRNLDAQNSIRLHNPIPLELAREVMQVLLEGRYHINLYLQDELWTSDHPHYTAAYAKTSGVTPNMTDDLLSAMTAPPTKIMVIDDHRVDPLLAELNERFSGRLSFCRSRSNFCEVIDVSASKWNALKTLADVWGILPEEIMAIGDQGNDISMIHHAGVGVAMGNAPDDVKRLANYVTTTIHEDGAAEAIERFVLNSVPISP